ncbi:MAG: YncE family protein [Candidatus Bathyarchaeia archaeon]
MKHGATKTLRVGCVLLVVFFLCAFTLLPQPVRAQDAVTATIPVGSNPKSVAVTPNGAYAYVTNCYARGSVSVISTATNTVTATVTVGRNPYGVAITPNGAYAYVTNCGNSSVSVISTATNAVTATITVGWYPYDVAITPDGAYGYVTLGPSSISSGSVAVINTATYAVTATSVNNPFGVAITPNGEYAFVTNPNITSSGTVSVISTPNALVAPTITATPVTTDQGRTISLTSSAVTTGTPPYMYQWLAEAPGASSYSSISGAISSNYSFATTDFTTNGTWNFELHVTDNFGEQATSNATSVTMNVAPTERTLFSAVDWVMAVIVIVIVLFLITIALYRERKKKTQQTQTT